MSKNSKKAQSGLKTVKRDWSTGSVDSIPKLSQEIYWPPTPPKPDGPPLTGTQKRLKDIQDALAGKTPRIDLPAPLATSKAFNKRPSDTQLPNDHQPAPLAKKPRQLPSSWKDEDPMTSSTRGTSSSRSRDVASKLKSTTSAAPVSTGSGDKVAGVFLSQEQTRILHLVKEGSSVFYTGSAGTQSAFAHISAVFDALWSRNGQIGSPS